MSQRTSVVEDRAAGAAPVVSVPLTVRRAAVPPASSSDDSRGSQSWGRPSPIHKPVWIAIAVGLLLAAFVGDYLTGNEVSSSLYYVITVAVGAWFIGRNVGLILALLSTGAWALSYSLVGEPFSKSSILYWNLVVELGIYLTTALAVSRVRAGLEKERLLSARLDEVNRALDREAMAVGELQRELLPRRAPVVPGYQWEIHYATSTRAGGDYYDFFPLADGRIGIFLADASGHGAPAAVLMAMTRVLLHTAPRTLAPPDRVLAELNRQLAHTLPQSWFVTACYAILDPVPGRFVHALAGHPPPLVMHAADETPQYLHADGGPPLGLFPESRYGSGSTQLQPGDTLALYTDGLTEAMSPSGNCSARNVSLARWRKPTRSRSRRCAGACLPVSMPTGLALRSRTTSRCCCCGGTARTDATTPDTGPRARPAGTARGSTRRAARRSRESPDAACAHPR
jgi:hypothetical protein